MPCKVIHVEMKNKKKKRKKTKDKLFPAEANIWHGEGQITVAISSLNAE